MTLRVGINLGEVLVAPSWESGGFSVSGDAVNVASRLCGEAGPGEVLVAAALLSVVPSSLRWSDEVHVNVRGRELPVAVRRQPEHEGRRALAARHAIPTRRGGFMASMLRPSATRSWS